ncbi:MAG: hypothetical protein ABIH89_01925 [Elusimicrobiota bacterium]
MKTIIRQVIALLILFSASAHAGIEEYVSDKELIMNLIDKAAGSVTVFVSENADKGKTIILHNMAGESGTDKDREIQSLIDDALIREISKKGMLISESNRKIFAVAGRPVPASGRPDASYVLGFRLIDASVHYEKDRARGKYMRIAVTKLNCRLVDTGNGNILWSDSIEETSCNIIPKKLYKHLNRKTPVQEDDHYTAKESAGPKKSAAPDYSVPDGTTIGLCDWVSCGIGYCEFENLNLAIEGGIGYMVMPGITAGLNIGYFPYKYIKDSGNAAAEEFKGEVFSVCVYEKTEFYEGQKTHAFFVAGLGVYTFVGHIQPSLPGVDSRSGSEFIIGFNTGLGADYDLGKNLNLVFQAKYHYTGYDFGRDFQFITSGLEYHF